MASSASMSGSHWGSLIQPDKTASPLLEQLCLGLGKLIATLDPKDTTKNLTPTKLAAFYRSVGGNYDPLFLGTSNSGLSFIYQSLGCFHTLQPTSNPFEPPAIPCLLPNGFVRWQTIQLLLSPEEHVPYLQSAVKQYNVINPAGGGTFPKTIPRDAFPATADPDMVKWHENVGHKLQRDHQARRLRTSPHHSPRSQSVGQDPPSPQQRPAFPPRRPSHPNSAHSRDSPSEQHLHRHRSLPDEVQSPGADATYVWVNSSNGSKRTQHAKASPQSHHASSSTSSTGSHPRSQAHAQAAGSRRGSQQTPHYRQPTAISISSEDSASDASSEESDSHLRPPPSSRPFNPPDEESTARSRRHSHGGIAAGRERRPSLPPRMPRDYRDHDRRHDRARDRERERERARSRDYYHHRRSRSRSRSRDDKEKSTKGLRSFLANSVSQVNPFSSNNKSNSTALSRRSGSVKYRDRNAWDESNSGSANADRGRRRRGSLSQDVYDSAPEPNVFNRVGRYVPTQAQIYHLQQSQLQQQQNQGMQPPLGAANPAAAAAANGAVPRYANPAGTVHNGFSDPVVGSVNGVGAGVNGSASGRARSGSKQWDPNGLGVGGVPSQPMTGVGGRRYVPSGTVPGR